MDALERLDAIEQIKRLKARYFLTLDDHDWDGYAAVFTEDGLLDLEEEQEFHRGKAVDPGPAGPPWVARGRDQIKEFITAALDTSVSVHEGHTPTIEITGPDSATGVWGLHDYITFPDGSSFHGYGRYHETYRKVSGDWLIASMSISRIRLDWAGKAGSDELKVLER
jgi:hypothetical protein